MGTLLEAYFAMFLQVPVVHATPLVLGRFYPSMEGCVEWSI